MNADDGMEPLTTLVHCSMTLSATMGVAPIRGATSVTLPTSDSSSQAEQTNPKGDPSLAWPPPATH